MRIVPIYFLASLLISLLILFIIAPEPQVVVKYPNLYDNESNVYVDDEGVCYKYKLNKVE